MTRLSTIVLTDADGTLPVEAVGPETVELNIAFAEIGMGNQEPGTEDTLGKNIQDSVGDNLAVNTDDAGTISKTPDTKVLLGSRHIGMQTWRLTWGRQSRE